MNTKVLKSMKVLKDAIDSKKLVIFAGAGTSVDAGAPSWQTLVDELRKGISIPENEHDFLKISQIYYNERRHKEYLDEVRKVLKYKTLSFNQIHELIFELSPEHILTTNYDDLFEQVIKHKAHPFSVIRKDSDFPYANNTNLLVKIHGDLEEGNIVLKEDDYINYSNNFPLIESFMKGLFATKVILFLGYSFSDYNLKYIINSVKNILGNDFQQAYLLSFDKNANPAMHNYLKAKGINVIHYDEVSDDLEGYLLGKNAYSQAHQREVSNLSTLGNKLISFLKFLIKYKDFTENISKYDIITQMQDSLGRFSEFTSLPPAFVTNLFPFNVSPKPVFNYRYANFTSNNQKVKELFHSFLEDDGTLKDEFFTQYSISIEEKDRYNKTVEKIFRTLNFSSLYFFTNSINSYNFPNKSDLRGAYLITAQTTGCDCLTCLLGNFKYSELFSRLKSIVINETSDIQQDMLVAYINYKLGYFTLSFHQFESIANKSWQMGKYKLYYVAKRNAKHLRNLIDSHFTRTDNQKISEILDRISTINLDKLIFQIPKLDDDEYSLLKTIRDNTVLKECEISINGISDKITQQYVQSLISQLDQRNFYDYSANITHHLLDVFKFYNNNCIVQDEYLEFSRVFQKGVRSLFMNHATGLKYGYDIPFQWWVFKLMIQYVDPITFFNDIREFKIDSLKLISTDQDLFSEICNLLNSTLNDNLNFAPHISPSKDLLSHLQNSFFENKFNETLSNAFIVLSIIEIPEKYQPILVQKVINFIKAENYFHGIHYRHVTKFLSKYKKHFSAELLHDLLKNSIEKPNLLFDWNYWNLIHGVCKECDLDLLPYSVAL